MDVLASIPFRLIEPTVTFGAMEEAEKKRNWIKITDDIKRKMTHLSVDAGAASVEEFGGDLLAEIVEQRWIKFDPKRGAPKPAKTK